jgi:anti-anti-sigma factor
MNTTFTTEVNGNWLVAGKLNFQTVAALWQSSHLHFQQAMQPICVDLSGVTQSDSASVALLAAWMRQAHNLQKQIYFKNLPPQMQAIMHVSGLEMILPIQK